MVTSCGGTLNVCTRMSIISTMSTQGTMKKTPGPRAPPDNRRPSRNMTALSYSLKHYINALSNVTKCKIYTWTTFTTKSRENGRVTKISSTEQMTIRWAQIPWPSSHAKTIQDYIFFNSFYILPILSTLSFSFPFPFAILENITSPLRNQCPLN